MYYTYRQNNSGGVWDIDEENGIGQNVIVEADSPEEADTRAEEIGLYFGGAGDCPCCGDRWYPTHDDGDPFPSYYGEPVYESVHLAKKEHTYIHAKNGEVTRVIIKD